MTKGERTHTNRNYSWGAVPPEIQGWKFTKNAVHGPVDFTVNVIEPGVLYVCFTNSVAAVMYTIITSAARHHLDLWAYLDDESRSLAGGPSDLESLLPDRWAVAHPESIWTYRQQESLARAAQTKARRARRRRLARR